MVALHTELPIIADADTGFGGPLDISRTVRLYEHAGIAGLHIEDQVMAGSRSRCALICMDAQSHQVFPKRCGQLQGKDVVALEVFIERVRSAVEARQDPDFVIIARTDARQAKKFGGPHAGSEAFHEGIKRLKAAVAAGADMVFMGSPRTEDECRTLVKEMGDVPVPINVLPNSHSQLQDIRLNRLGFRTAIYPCTGSIPAMLAMQRSYGALKATEQTLKRARGTRSRISSTRLGWARPGSLTLELASVARRKLGRKEPRRGVEGHLIYFLEHITCIATWISITGVLVSAQ